ncbi:meiotically up-regulated gene 113-domain-containing protein [Lipomyces chichibuensis]|uniref:meiotically up-regulated gene 113-domain-containing protein n=1 Tax=Lipomyces chichibuensis TaxID=1546026 RepID=UPI0033432CA4
MHADDFRARNNSERLPCNGIAKTTKQRCRRMVDSKYALDDNTAYCFQHRYQGENVKSFKQKSVSGVNEDYHNEISNCRTHHAYRHSHATGQAATFNTNDVIIPMRESHAKKKKNGFSKFWRRLFCMYVDGQSDFHWDRQTTNQHSFRQHNSSTHPPSCHRLNNATVKVYNVARVAPAVSAKYVNLLAEELKKPISQADEAGYIYIYELASPYRKGPVHPDTILYLKIGRAKNVDRRMHQWTSQCSHAVILTGHFPSPVGISSSSMHEYIGGTKCRAVHRAERLIHLELRAMFPCSAERGEVFPLSLTGSVRDGICSNCGKRHTEWFAVSQLDAHIVLRIISKWIEYVGVI